MRELILIAAIFCTGIVSAQTSDAVQTAFSNSYMLEKSALYENAAAEIKKVYQEKSYEQNLRLGWLMYESAKYPESISYYQKAVDLNANSVEAKLGIVYPLSAQNKWDDVLKQYNAILAIDAKNTLVNYRTGLIYYNRKNYAQAKRYFDAYAELYPFDYDATVMCGWTDYNLGKKEEAKSYFQRALLNRPGDKSASEGMGLCK